MDRAINSMINNNRFIFTSEYIERMTFHVSIDGKEIHHLDMNFMRYSYNDPMHSGQDPDYWDNYQYLYVKACDDKTILITIRDDKSYNGYMTVRLYCTHNYCKFTLYGSGELYLPRLKEYIKLNKEKIINLDEQTMVHLCSPLRTFTNSLDDYFGHVIGINSMVKSARSSAH